MFHNNRNDVIETDDIADVQHVHITQEDGKPVAWIKAILDPRKDYQALKDVFVHLSNGINQPRMLGPFEHAQPAPVAETAPTTEPLVEPSDASTTPQGTATAAEVTDVSSTSDTVQIPTVTGKKGN